jgi:hypothetical protein
MAARLEGIRITPDRYVLAWLPFLETSHDYVQERLNLAVNRAMAGLAAGKPGKKPMKKVVNPAAFW